MYLICFLTHVSAGVAENFQNGYSSLIFNSVLGVWTTGSIKTKPIWSLFIALFSTAQDEIWHRFEENHSKDACATSIWEICIYKRIFGAWMMVLKTINQTDKQTNNTNTTTFTWLCKPFPFKYCACFHYNNDSNNNDDDDNDDDNNSNDNEHISRAPLLVKHAQLRWTGVDTKIQNTGIYVTFSNSFNAWP